MIPPNYTAAMYKLIDHSLYLLYHTGRLTRAEVERARKRNRKLKSKEFLASRKRKP